MQLTMVVLPVPGPPVMMSTLSLRAAATAPTWSGARTRPALLLDPADEVLQMQRRVAPGGLSRRPRVWATPVSATQAGLLVTAPPVRSSGSTTRPFPGQGFQGSQQGPPGPPSASPRLRFRSTLFRDVDVALPGLGLQDVEQPRGQAGRGQGVEVEAGRPGGRR